MSDATDTGRDWAYWQHHRAVALAHLDAAPKYLLLPEVRALLAHEPDAVRHFLLDTLWHTGARVSEALSLTPPDFVLDGPPYVSIPTAKQTRRGRPARRRRAAPPRRAIGVRDPAYLEAARRFLATHARRKDRYLWPIRRQTAANWVAAAADRAEAAGVVFGVRPTPKVLRHSFAVNALLQHCSLEQVQRWLGHTSPATTEIYLDVISYDIGDALAGVAF